MEQVFTLTQKAIDTIKRVMSDNGIDASKLGVRIGLIGSGCNGFSFHMDFEVEKSGDYVIDYPDFKVIVDPMSLMYFDGMIVDYNDSDLMTGGFIFNNPAVTSSCGCKKSVSFD